MEDSDILYLRWGVWVIFETCMEYFCGREGDGGPEIGVILTSEGKDQRRDGCEAVCHWVILGHPLMSIGQWKEELPGW